MTVYGSTLLGRSVIQIDHGKPPRTYPGDRFCRFCSCRLSRYNPGTACAPCAQQEQIEAENARDATWLGNLYSEIPEDCEPELFRLIVQRAFGSLRAAERAMGWTHNLLGSYTAHFNRLPEWRREALNQAIAERRSSGRLHTDEGRSAKRPPGKPSAT